MTEQNLISIGLFEGYVELTEEEMLHLRQIGEHPAWNTLRKILKDMDDAMTISLRDRSADVQDLRYYQGVSACAGRLADLVEEDVEQWYKDRAEAEAEEPEPEGNSEEA